MNNNIDPNTNNNTNDVSASNVNTNPVQQPIPTSTTPINTVSNSIQEPKIAEPVIQTPAVSPAPVTAPTPVTLETNGTKDDEVVEEKPKKEKYVPKTLTPEEEKKASRKRKVAFVFLLLMIIYVIFMPEINSFVRNYQVNKQISDDNKTIETGELICTLDRTTSNYDVNYTQRFKFTSSKLDSLDYIITTKGDESLDADDLNSKLNSCKIISDLASSLKGISISCDLDGGTFTETNKFDYSTLDLESINSAYAEQGGTAPEYKYKQSIDEIQKNKNAEGFTCNRSR